MSTFIDEVELNDLGIILYRIVTDTDGKVSYRRISLVPGADLTGQPAEIVTMANDAWTPEVRAAYQAQAERMP